MGGTTVMTPLRLAVTESTSGGEVVIELAGEFDLSCEGLFAKTVTHGEMQKGRAAVILDLAEVTFLDSSGIHALLEAREEALLRGSRLLLLRPSAAVRRVLEVSGVAERLEIGSENAPVS